MNVVMLGEQQEQNLVISVLSSCSVSFTLDDQRGTDTRGQPFRLDVYKLIHLYDKITTINVKF